jgi:peptide/nickel transport system substrate-binding protein
MARLAASMPALRLAWYDAPDHAAQKSVCDKIQLQTFSEAPYLPLGQILQPTVHRKDLTGILPGFAKFWGVRKA